MKSISFLIALSITLSILGQFPTVGMHAAPYQTSATPTAEIREKEAREELARRYAMNFTDPIFDERDIQRDLSVRESKWPPRPQEALKAGVGRTVVVLMIIQKDGMVNDAIVTKDVSQGLDEYAVDTIKQWRFSPPMKDGQPAAFVKVFMYLGGDR
jgi:TonB family protein